MAHFYWYSCCVQCTPALSHAQLLVPEYGVGQKVAREFTTIATPTTISIGCCVLCEPMEVVTPVGIHCSLLVCTKTGDILNLELTPFHAGN